MIKVIAFQREGKTIIAQVFLTTREPSETGNGRQVVFFCKDETGHKYRVPRSEVVFYGNRVPKSLKKKDRKPKAKKRKDKVS